MSNPQGRERRRLRRYMKRIPARFQSQGVIGQGYVKNLSKGGLFLRTDRLPLPGAPVRVIIEPEAGDKIEISGVVRWTTAQLENASEATPGFGLQLDGDSAEYAEFFERTLLR